MDNKWMLSPMHPNWNAIYKEFGENGLTNLQNLPVWVLQQMNDANTSYNLGPINGDSPVDKHILSNYTVDDVIKEAKKQGYYQGVEFPTDVELRTGRKINHVDGSNLKEFEGLTVGDMIEHTIQKGYASHNDFVGDNQRYSPTDIVSSAKPVDRSSININYNEHLNARPINGDSLADKEWLSNTTVGEMIERTKKQGLYQDFLPEGELPLNAETLQQQLKNSTIGDMIEYSKNNGYELNDLLPDSERLSVKELTRNHSIIDRNKVDLENKQARMAYEKQQIEQKIKQANKEWYQKNQIEIDNNIRFANSRFDIDTEQMDAMFNNFENSFNEVSDNVSAHTETTKTTKAIAKETAQEALEEVTDNTSTAKKLLKKHGLNSVINLGLTIADYKESRREGQGVLKSAAKAGVNFAIGETLGMAMIPFSLAGSLPTMAIKGVEHVNKMQREMNSIGRMEPFSGTYFQDTQQMATMRQSGMEMAKMANYNLQQTLMGNEASYMHR